MMPLMSKPICEIPVFKMADWWPFCCQKNEENRNFLYVWVYIFTADHHITVQFDPQVKYYIQMDSTNFSELQIKDGRLSAILNC